MTKHLNQPLGANALPKFAGPTTFMRLPSSTADKLDACFIGVPFDLGTSYRVGTRFGPVRYDLNLHPFDPTIWQRQQLHLIHWQLQISVM